MDKGGKGKNFFAMTIITHQKANWPGKGIEKKKKPCLSVLTFLCTDFSVLLHGISVEFLFFFTGTCKAKCGKDSDICHSDINAWLIRGTVI